MHSTTVGPGIASAANFRAYGAAGGVVLWARKRLFFFETAAGRIASAELLQIRYRRVVWSTVYF
jgi:hypothetical protein